MRRPSSRRCGNCGTTLFRRRCPSCDLYSAGVAAQQAAAKSLADARYPGSTGAWLNEYGSFAWVDGVTKQIGTAEEAAAFDVTTAARRVHFPATRPTADDAGKGGAL